MIASPAVDGTPLPGGKLHPSGPEAPLHGPEVRIEGVIYKSLPRRAHTPKRIGLEQWFPCRQFSRIRHTPSYYDEYDPLDQWRSG